MPLAPTSHRVSLAYVAATLVILAATTSTVNAQSAIPFYNDADPSFLFIGNSYTGFNTLHAMFGSVMKDGVMDWADSTFTSAINPGGKNLGGHYTDFKIGGGIAAKLAPAATNENQWKWVVLQDQSQVPGFYPWEDDEDSAFTASRVGAQGLNENIVLAGGQTMFYMTWGRRDGDEGNPGFYPDFPTMQAKLTEGYMRYNAATTTAERPTFVAPVGLAFETIYEDLIDQGIMPTDSGTLFHQLYTGDASHPAPPGSYVAALTIFSSMTGLDPTSINFFPDGMDEATARALQDAVSRTILQTFENGFIPYPWTRSWTGSIVGAGGAGGETPVETSTPTMQPTRTTTLAPTNSPTPEPTIAITTRPTGEPTIAPMTSNPTVAPIITNRPSINIQTSNPTVITETSNPTVITGTNNPTVITDTSNPTVIPAEASTNTSATTKGSISVTIGYDLYPQDIAWTFLAEGAEDALYFQPYDTFAEPFSNQTVTFDDLEQNQTYLFKVIDKMGDGLFGNHGNGYFTIADRNGVARSTTLFDSPSSFGAYYEVDLEVLSSGRAAITNTSANYKPSSWPSLESVLWAPETTSVNWPGDFPRAPISSLVVNMDVYDNIEELSWELLYSNQTDIVIDTDMANMPWLSVADWSGSATAGGPPPAIEFGDLEPGWYRFLLKDSTGDGFGNSSTVLPSNMAEFVTLTGPLTSTQDMGLVWGSNGEFESEEEVWFYMDMAGFISHTRFVSNKDARSAPSPSPAPSMSVAQLTPGSTGTPALSSAAPSMSVAQLTPGATGTPAPSFTAPPVSVSQSTPESIGTLAPSSAAPSMSVSQFPPGSTEEKTDTLSPTADKTSPQPTPVQAIIMPSEGPTDGSFPDTVTPNSAARQTLRLLTVGWIVATFSLGALFL